MVFSWKSTLPPILTLSTNETDDTGYDTGVISLIEHGNFKGSSKDVHLRWCFVHDCINTGVLRRVQTPTRDQLVDIGTKVCPAPQFKFQRSLLHGGL